MPNTQIYIPEDVDRKLQVFKAEKGLRTKEQAIVDILKEYLSVGKE